ncbi:RNA-binding protein 24 isoform X3 [Pteropus vampyrus]|uniref:RNA-binding protein 24 isoform X3 n=1 Tax=Pteropus vampyrus TaxID=132908 RepID=A0A6P3QPE5_PTEVA|nr:RNA-binding protein 24 isoform X3 [Pteropus vampyrus]
MTWFLLALGKIYKSKINKLADLQLPDSQTGYLPTMSIRRLSCSLEWSFHTSSRPQLLPPPHLTLITLEPRTHNTQRQLLPLPPPPPMTSTPTRPLQLLRDTSPLGATATRCSSQSPRRHLGQLLPPLQQLPPPQHSANISLSSCKQTECSRPAI